MNRKEYGRRFPLKPIETPWTDYRAIYWQPSTATSTSTVAHTVEISPGTVLVDVGTDGGVIGVEYLRGAA